MNVGSGLWNWNWVMQGAALAGLLGLGAFSVAQTAPAAKVPDAQVEANVLKALAGAQDLANQPMTTTTVYGVVTLSGSVQTEAMRTEAENIVSRTAGVVKVVDEMTLSGDAGASQQPMANGGQLQSDGTMAPATAQDQQQAQGAPDNSQAAPNQAAGPNYGPGAPEYRQPYNGQHAPNPPDIRSNSRIIRSNRAIHSSPVTRSSRVTRNSKAIRNSRVILSSRVIRSRAIATALLSRFTADRRRARW